MRLSTALLVVVVLFIVAAILNFAGASDFSGISFTSGDAIFSISFSAVFVIVGILDLVAAFGLFRKYEWATILAGTLAIIDVFVPVALTVVSILALLVLAYLNRGLLSSVNRPMNR